MSQQRSAGNPSRFSLQCFSRSLAATWTASPAARRATILLHVLMVLRGGGTVTYPCPMGAGGFTVRAACSAAILLHELVVLGGTGTITTSCPIIAIGTIISARRGCWWCWRWRWRSRRGCGRAHTHNVQKRVWTPSQISQDVHLRCGYQICKNLTAALPGFCSNTNAAPPETRGHAIEMPYKVTDPVSDLCEADKIDDPGAQMSVQEP